MLTVKVEGYKEAKAILDELPNNMQKRMLRTALRSAAKPILQSSKNKVPTKTGTLRKQLRIVTYRDRNAPKSEVDVAVKPVFNRTKKRGEINEYYGKFIHEGTKDPRTSRKRGKLLVFENQSGRKVFVRAVNGIKAQPFLEEGYKESAEKTITSFGDELAKSVEKFVSKNFQPIIK